MEELLDAYGTELSDAYEDVLRDDWNDGCGEWDDGREDHFHMEEAWKIMEKEREEAARVEEVMYAWKWDLEEGPVLSFM